MKKITLTIVDDSHTETTLKNSNGDTFTFSGQANNEFTSFLMGHKNQEWFKVTEKLPEFGRKVLWRCVMNYVRSEEFDFFVDELTNEIENVDNGATAYLLSENPDYLVVEEGGYHDELTEYASHWCELPNLEPV